MEPAGKTLTHIIFLLNARKPGAAAKEVNTWLLSCCRHQAELCTEGVKNRNSSSSSRYLQTLDSFLCPGKSFSYQ